MEEDSIYIVFPELWSQGCKQTQKGSKKGRRQGLYMPLSWNMAHNRNMGQLLGWPDIHPHPPLYILTWFISGTCHFFPLHFSVNGTTIYHYIQVKTVLSQRKIKLPNPHVSREDRMSNPLPSRIKRRNSFGIFEGCCDVTFILSSAVSTLPKITLPSHGGHIPMTDGHRSIRAQPSCPKAGKNLKGLPSLSL